MIGLLKKMLLPFLLWIFAGFFGGCSAHIKTGMLSYRGSMPADAAEMDAAVWVDATVTTLEFTGHFRPGVAASEVINGVKGLLIAVGLP